MSKQNPLFQVPPRFDDKVTIHRTFVRVQEALAMLQKCVCDNKEAIEALSKLEQSVVNITNITNNEGDIILVNIDASSVDYDDTLTGLGDNVQVALDALYAITQAIDFFQEAFEVPYDDSVSGLGADVQAALDALKVLIDNIDQLQDADEVPYDDSLTGLGPDVQAAIDNLKTLVDSIDQFQDADEVPYDDSFTGLGTQVQEAIDNLAAIVNSKQNKLKLARFRIGLAGTTVVNNTVILSFGQTDKADTSIITVAGTDFTNEEDGILKGRLTLRCQGQGTGGFFADAESALVELERNEAGSGWVAIPGESSSTFWDGSTGANQRFFMHHIDFVIYDAVASDTQLRIVANEISGEEWNISNAESKIVFEHWGPQ